MKLSRHLPLFAALTVLSFAFGAGLCSASPNHYVYVFPPGSIDVYDMDNGFSLVKSVPFPLTKGQSPVYVRGGVASAATGMLYLSYGSDTAGGSMLKYDLVKDSIVWTQSYSFGVDSMSISPDGQKIYMPTGEGAYTQGIWQVIDANTGSLIGSLDSGGKGPHNTNTSLSGAHIYLGPRYSNYLVLADANTLSIIRNIGPVTAGVRPFTTDANEKYAFITTSGNVGFEVSDINTGQNLYWVCPPGFCWTSGSYNSISGVSHGISLSPDNREIYLIDLPYNHVHVFDVTGLPGTAPVDVADIPLNCKLPDEGWLQHSRDGRFVWVGDCGDVIDTGTRKIVANMPSLLNTRIFNEVDVQTGVPSFSPLSRNQGGYTTQASTVSLSNTSLSFGNVTVGATSSAQLTTLTNTGSTAVSITGISVTGADNADFSQTDTCGNSVAAGGNCTISVTFAPSSAGAKTAAVTITDSDSSSPQVISLTGTGVSPSTTASISPASLTFATQTVGTASGAQTLTLTDTGSASLAITGITVSGDFAETNSCGGSVAIGTSCVISVTFKPTATGTRTGIVSIADNTSGSPQTISLTGTGSPATTTASAAPASLSFGNLNVGSISPAQTVTLSNTGGAALSISSISIDKNFTEANTCGTSLAAGSNCTISVTFSPTTPAGYAGILTISDNAANSPQTVTLTGTGVGPQIQLSPTGLTFGNQTVNASSAAQTATLSNTGNAALTITGITASGDFAESNSCGGSLAAGANCTISVTFKPTATGTRTGMISITDNAGASPQTLSLTGTGSSSNIGDFSISASSSLITTASGQSTTFTLSAMPTGGFNKAVSLTCLGAPQSATCMIAPNLVTPNGTSPSTATVTVTTMAHSSVGPIVGPQAIRPWTRLEIQVIQSVILMAFMALATLLTKKGRQMSLAMGLALLAVILVAGCAGITAGTSPNGTPAGTYTLTLTGSSGTGANALTHSTTVTLNVN